MSEGRDSFCWRKILKVCLERSWRLGRNTGIPRLRGCAAALGMTGLLGRELVRGSTGIHRSTRLRLAQGRLLRALRFAWIDTSWRDIGGTKRRSFDFGCAFAQDDTFCIAMTLRLVSICDSSMSIQPREIRDALELVDIDGVEDRLGVAVTRDADHGSTELFGRSDVLREATFQEQR